MLTLGPPSGLHAVADDRGGGTNREVFVAFENEDRGAIGAIADELAW